MNPFKIVSDKAFCDIWFLSRLLRNAFDIFEINATNQQSTNRCNLDCLVFAISKLTNLCK